MNVIDMRTRKPIDPKTVTTAERMQALLLASMNDDYASLRDPDSLKTLLQMNAHFLRSIANDSFPQKG